MRKPLKGCHVHEEEVEAQTVLPKENVIIYHTKFSSEQSVFGEPLKFSRNLSVNGFYLFPKSE